MTMNFVARAIVAAFEAARAAGRSRAELDGSPIEVPTYSNAKRLIARGEALRQFARDG
jgi:citrate lyase subunit beta/citryl-CoA lyase